MVRGETAVNKNAECSLRQAIRRHDSADKQYEHPFRDLRPNQQTHDAQIGPAGGGGGMQSSSGMSEQSVVW